VIMHSCSDLLIHTFLCGTIVKLYSSNTVWFALFKVTVIKNELSELLYILPK